MKLIRANLTAHFRAHWLFYLLVVTGVALDLGSKAAAFAALEHHVVYVKDPRQPVPPLAEHYASGLHPVALATTGADHVIIRPPRREVISDFFALQLSFNPGAMFGMLPNVMFLVLFTIAAMAVIIYILTRLKPGQEKQRIGLALIAAGALANMYDRIVHHAVRDFLDFSADFWPALAGKFRQWFGHTHWPTFNVADIYIVAGVALLFILIIFEKKKPAEQQDPKRV